MAVFHADEGIDNFSKMLEQLENTEELCGRILYEGARVVADACKESIRSLPVQDGEYQGSSEKPLIGITKTQKEDLEESFGITPMQVDNGVYHVKVGFDGYGSRPTKKYPRGVPNAMLARSIESGTTFRRKIPFIRPALIRSKEAAIQAMQKALDRKIQDTRR